MPASWVLQEYQQSQQHPRCPLPSLPPHRSPRPLSFV